MRGALARGNRSRHRYSRGSAPTRTLSRYQAITAFGAGRRRCEDGIQTSLRCCERCYCNEIVMDHPREIRLIPVYLTDEIRPGDDLLQKLVDALQHQKLALANNDVVVIKHKVISKAEGQVV